MEFVDCHTHTFYSDGRGSVSDNVAAAAALGLTTLCITDHLTLPYSMDPTCEVSIAERDLASYLSDIAEARKTHPEIDVICGFECDYYPGCEKNIRRWAAGADYLLGSVHMLDGSWIDDLSDLSYWDAHTTQAVWERYFDVWAQACSSSVGFDSMAHPDLVSLLGRFPEKAVLERFYDSAAQAAADCKVRIEVNTAGTIKPVGRLYPDATLLERFYRAGVPVTVGSDAHTPDRVGDRLSQAYALLRAAGYTFVDVPCAGGGWRKVSLY